MKKLIQSIGKMFKKNDYLVVHFDHELDNFNPICGMEAEIKKTLADKEAGEFNCHEMMRKNGHKGEGYLYFDTKDGKKLFNLIKPIVKKANFVQNPKARVFSNDGSEEMDM